MSRPILERLFKDEGVDFPTAFPMPAGTEELRQKLMQRMSKEKTLETPKKVKTGVHCVRSATFV
jgi:hypothetical protein